MTGTNEQSLRDRVEGSGINRESRLDQAQAIIAELLALSADFTGNEPAEFLSDSDAINCREFIELSRQRPVPWTELKLRVKTQRPDNTYDWPTTWQGSGVLIGKTKPADSKVFLCQDGMLRCNRGAEFKDPLGIGYGTIPKGIEIVIGQEVPGRIEGGEYFLGEFRQESLSDMLYTKLTYPL